MKLKDHVLASLLLAEGEFRSGSALAQELGVSRTAVWKAIEQLKAEGCEIQAITNRGYQLQNLPDLYNQAYLESLLAGCRMPWKVQYFPEIDSTNRLAKELAGQGAPAGTVIVAEKQTAGRGRLGKSFHSPEGGLYLTVILRPELPLTDMMAVTACTASAVHLALQDHGITAQIKWVNDLFLNGRKICGILTEGSFNAELLAMDYIVIGIGINLHPDPQMPEELRPIVTNLQAETGQSIQRCQLLAGILRHLEELMDGIRERTYLPVYREHSYTIGKRVLVKTSQGDKICTAVGFADDAGLIVRLDDGTEETIRTGTAQIVG